MGQVTASIREEIEETRERMGDTLQALAHKADLKGRTKEWVGDKKDATAEKVRAAHPGSRMTAVGRAGLSGWRAKVARRASGPVASRTRFTEKQVEAVIGGAFLALATIQFVMLARRAWRAGRAEAG
jgi:hypothetical protein